MPESETLEGLLRPEDVCDMLKISPTKFYRLVTSGRLPAVKIGATWRIKPSALRALIESQAERSRFKNPE